MRTRRLGLLLLLAGALLWLGQGMWAAPGEHAATGTSVTTAEAAAAPAPQSKAKTKTVPPVSDRQTTITDAAGRKHTQMKKVTPPERQAAAARLKALKLAAPAPDPNAPVALSLVEPAPGETLPVPSYYKIAANGELVPDYSGMVANWANSPMPTVTITGTPVTVGNGLVARANASDYPAAVGELAPILVVLPAASLPQGTLTGFRIFNQATAGSSPFPSAGNRFHAYVLRPGAGSYLVVFDTGELMVPPTADPVGEIVTFPVPNVPVNAGDIIAFYGQGIPVDTGGGTDILVYSTDAALPVPAPVEGSTITVGSSPYPIYPDPRTYSFGASVIDATQTTTTITGGMRKFVDGLPGLNFAGRNNLNQYIPVAIPDTTTYPGSDYYEIELGQYTEKMHSDLPLTTLRGYRQTNTTDTNVSQFHYLGPLITATKGRPVRVKFTNNLPTGAAGNLFIPVDPTVMGAGPGALASRAVPADIECRKFNPATGAPTNPAHPGAPPAPCYSENRAAVHLHGGVTPWISDGTTHQWITPAGEETQYPTGVSVYNVPDMPDPGKPTVRGEITFYYTNDQSARLMFYHDHAHGITRLGVYAGEAAGYLLTDPMEQALMASGGPLASVGQGTPLIIQDKTFVDATTIREQDPTWNWGTGASFTTLVDDNNTPGDTSDDRTMQLREAKTGDLWWPHVYMPAQNVSDLSGMNAMGRWNYGPWFWPPTNNIPFGPVANPYYDCNVLGLPDTTHPCTRPWQPVEIPGTANPSWGAEAFLDTPVINGTAYPTMTVEPKAYRFRILNAAHDRFWNLQWYQADPNQVFTDPITGETRLTEVRMVPAEDGREGGVPEIDMQGPTWLQIGTEGGFLPMPVVVPNQHITWNGNPLTFNFGNVKDHALLLGPAERADVIVDFSAFRGQTLILYNDAPAAFPALDPRNDYYTGAPDLRVEGGVDTPLAGYGPNIRTIMQIKVADTTPAPAFDVDALNTAWAPAFGPDPDNPTGPEIQIRPGVFQGSQDPVIVGQTAYNEAYATTFPSVNPYWGYSSIFSTALSFQPAGTTCTDPNPLNCTVTMPMKAKAIQDEMGETFDDYGRMRSSLGLTLAAPLANGNNFILQGFSDPPTELIKLSRIQNLVGDPINDGTQIWKITHNGVDTHPVHFHLFHVQLINRVGWDNNIRLPDATELGWKDTVRISPLEDTIVALRPISPSPAILPWELPNSHRLIEPALPAGTTWPGVDPLGNPITVVNQMTNLGWEYIWHCHILSHEENDMMRAVGFAVPPNAPTNLTMAQSGNRVRLNWVQHSGNESGFQVQRSSDTTFTSGVVTTNLGPNVTTFTDGNGTWNGVYRYRVRALNTIGSAQPGFPTLTAESDWSNTVDRGTVPVAPLAPSGLGGTAAATSNRAASVTLRWTDNSLNETGFTIQRALNANFTGASTFTVGVNVTTLTQTGLTRNATYYYRVRAANGGAYSAWSNAFSIITP